MTPSQTYAAVRRRLLDLASTMDAATQAKPVPALPGWSVRDTYAHLAGMCTDVLDQRLTGMPNHEWTAGQLAERAPLSFVDVCAEWEKRGPGIDMVLAAPGNERSALMVQDAWQHEQDVRGALGLPGDRNAETCAWMAGFTLTHLARRWPEGLPAVRAVAGGIDRTLGEGAPAATLRTDVYELARLTLGRRSRAQILALDWEGDPRPMLDHLHAFTLAEVELAE
ncbi:hypothetical protein AB0I28_04830 [Phytomonospora sp. NPDC050363]|uniref:hypothetical protein n=1 Tax=Phytomonospora sp. NPDC050363 TaxID=3155642 RepID=UPI0033ECEEE6